MKKSLIVSGYFIFFWLIIPVAIYLVSAKLDQVVFENRKLNENWLIPGFILAFPGLLLMLGSVYQFKHQSGEYPVSAIPPNAIIRRGLFAVWRHPIYLFASVTLLGSSMILRSYSLILLVLPVFMVLVSLYVRREEQNLVKRFGNEYLYYRNNVSLVIPHLYHWLRGPASIIFKLLFRLKIYNRENIPSSFPFIVISGHRHYLDPFWVSYAVPFPLKHISTYEMFRKPFTRKIFTWLGAIPRKRFARDIAGTQRIIGALRKGFPMCIFPEGGRSWTGQLRPLKTESLKMLRFLKDIPVLPVRIEGNYHSWPRWADRLMRSDISITFEKPFFVDPGMELSELETRLLQLIKPREEVELGKICRGRTRISHITKVIYRCPNCLSLQPPVEIVPDSLICNNCKTELQLKSNFLVEYYINGQKKTESIHSIYNSIKIKYSDIYNLLSKEITDNEREYVKPGERLIYMAAGQLWIEKNEVFSRFLRGLCVLSDKAITISDSERSQIIPLSEIGAVTIESNYKLQIYNEILETLYQITFDNDSALKWQDIIDNILTYQYNKQITTR